MKYYEYSYYAIILCVLSVVAGVILIGIYGKAGVAATACFVVSGVSMLVSVVLVSIEMYIDGLGTEAYEPTRDRR